MSFEDRSQTSWTLKNKNGNVHCCFKVNSTFGTIGNATANKMTAKVGGRNSELSL